MKETVYALLIGMVIVAVSNIVPFRWKPAPVHASVSVSEREPSDSVRRTAKKLLFCERRKEGRVCLSARELAFILLAAREQAPTLR
jgi:hypothetical protein